MAGLIDKLNDLKTPSKIFLTKNVLNSTKLAKYLE